MKNSLMFFMIIFMVTFSFAQDEPSKNNIYVFGLSYYQFQVMPSDRVIFLQEGRESGGQLGFRFSVLSRKNNRLKLINDFEFDFGTFNRKLGRSGSSGSISLQYYLGLNTKLKQNFASINTMAGLNFLWISGMDSYEGHTQSNYEEYYYGSDAWVWNSIKGGDGEPYYVNGYDSFTMIAPAMNISFNLEITYPLIFTMEYIGVLNSGLRNHIRMSLLLAIDR